MDDFLKFPSYFPQGKFSEVQSLFVESNIATHDFFRLTKYLLNKTELYEVLGWQV